MENFLLVSDFVLRISNLDLRNVPLITPSHLGIGGWVGGDWLGRFWQEADFWLPILRMVLTVEDGILAAMVAMEASLFATQSGD